MRTRILVLAVVLCAGVLSWQKPESAATPKVQKTTYRGVNILSQAVGHQYREDDWPAIAASPDGSLWVAWLSFNGSYDDVAIRQYRNGVWSNIHWVPNTSGDSWLPQIAVDAQNRPWVVWSQQLDANWDLYARRFDPAQQE